MAEETIPDAETSEDEVSYCVVKVEIPVAIQAQPPQSVTICAEKTFDWLGELQYLAPNATRFLRGIDFTQARYQLNALSLSDASGKEKEAVVRCLMWVVADSTSIALNRCANWCSFAKSASSIARLHNMPVPDFSFQPPTDAGEPFVEEIPVDLAEIMFPAWRTWVLEGDDGCIDKADLEQLSTSLQWRRRSFRSDVDTELIESLEEAVLHLSRVDEAPYQWRWIVEAMHSAVQNAMVSALAGTWDVRTLRKREAKKLVQEQHTELTELGVRLRATAKLDDFLNLYSKIKNPSVMGQFTHSKPYKATNSVDESISWLRDTRNLLKHFRVQTVEFDVSHWPEHCLNCLMVVRFLVEKSNNIVWHSPSKELLASSALTSAELALEAVRVQYAEALEAASDSTLAFPSVGDMDGSD